VVWQAITGAVSLPPVVRITTTPHTLSAARSRQRQWGTLRGNTKKIFIFRELLLMKEKLSWLHDYESMVKKMYNYFSNFAQHSLWPGHGEATPVVKHHTLIKELVITLSNPMFPLILIKKKKLLYCTHNHNKCKKSEQISGMMKTLRSCMSHLIRGAHAGFIWDMIGSPQLLDGLSWHGLWEAQTTPCVGRGPHLSHHRLLQHSCKKQSASDANTYTDNTKQILYFKSRI